MKRPIYVLLLPLLLLPLLCGCGKYDYFAHVSDLRSDLFLAETERFTLTVSCVMREKPYLDDGIASAASPVVEAVLAEKELSGAEYEIYFLEDVPRGGDMSFRSVTGDYYYSRSVETFPEHSLSVRVVCGEEATELVATSVKTENTLTPEEALEKATDAEQEALSKLLSNGVLHAEFHVRLLRRDKNYYYVGIISEQSVISLLLDSETGDVLARRVRE